MAKRHTEKKFKSPETKKTDADNREVSKALSEISDKLPDEIKGMIPPELGDLLGGGGLKDMMGVFFDFCAKISKSVDMNDVGIRGLGDNMAALYRKMTDIQITQDEILKELEKLNAK